MGCFTAYTYGANAEKVKKKKKKKKDEISSLGQFYQNYVRSVVLTSASNMQFDVFRGGISHRQGSQQVAVFK